MALVKPPHPLLLDCGVAFWVDSVQQSQIVVQRSNGSMLAWARNRRNALVLYCPPVSIATTHACQMFLWELDILLSSQRHKSLFFE